MIGGAPGTFTGRPVTEKSALGQSAVWQAVNLISGTCAGLPLHAYSKKGSSRQPLSSGRAAALLDNPHPDLTPYELWELVYGSLCLHGNAYLMKLHNQAGALAELWWINPNRVKAGRADDGTKKMYVLDGNTDPRAIRSDKTILHIPGFGYDGTVGCSPIRMARQAIALGMAAEEFGGTFFGNGSLATGMLQTEQRLDQAEATRLKALWKMGAHEGLDGAHDIRVVGSGATYTQLTIAPADAQFLETREFQITDIARWYGIPPHMLMQTEKSTSWGTGIETQNRGFITYTLDRYLVRVEQRMTKTIRPEPVYAKYTRAGLLRGDTAARGAFYRELFHLGSISPNEIRALEDWDPIEGGDATTSR